MGATGGDAMEDMSSVYPLSRLGLGVLERIASARPSLPVVVLSAVSDVESKVRCFKLGAADYMTKPFAIAELRARISARLRAPAPARQSFLRNNGLKLDVNGRIVET